VDYCHAQRLARFTLIADRNTYAALGERAEGVLKAAGLEVYPLVLEGDEVLANEHYLIHVLLHAPVDGRTYLAVGSGTLTDITRVISHRTRTAFISLPTAPSVDGFTSIGAPLIVSGHKKTYISQPPQAVFADLPTLCAAPQRLIAAGFGDLLGKINSLADWQLGQVLWDEGYDEAIAARTRRAVTACMEMVDAIGRRSEEGIRRLMEGLIESGLCMLDFGGSPPASGAEHHIAHYWEMKLVRENRHGTLHGAKVGYATILAAERYARLRQLSRAEMMDRLEQAALPDRAAEIAHIEAGYGSLSAEIQREQALFLNLTEEGFDQLKRRIAENWDVVQQIAASVPPPEQITDWLRRAGAGVEPAAIGLKAEDVPLGQEYGHYLRNRFTIAKLGRILGLNA
jgi:glycerol-1-phosphate dehydrogenase [NAD(P)+]